MVNPRNCRHENIYWEDLFKTEKVKEDGNANNTFQWNNAYCLDCGETKGKLFALKLQAWYCKKIEEWLKDNGLVEKFGNHYYFTNFKKFLKKNNYDEIWNKLKEGKIDEDYFDAFGGQMIFQEASIWTENLCREFKKEKEQEKPNDPNKDNPNHRERERERERERAKLQSDINKLVNKPNKTAEEEDELEKLKTKLKELEEENKKPNNQPTNQSDQSTNYLPLIIVSVIVVYFGLLLILFLKTRKKKHHK